VVGIVDDGSTQVGLFNNPGIMDADRFENLSASEDGMGAVTVYVEGGDIQAGFMAGLSRGACPEAAALSTGRGRSRDSPMTGS
jgi:hypothetical protein